MPRSLQWNLRSKDTPVSTSKGYGSFLLNNVGAILRFFGWTSVSSFSDSLVSLFPRTLPLTELDALIAPYIGVWGGVVQGKPVNAELEPITLGTLPSVGVGLLAMAPVGVCSCDVGTEEDEFVLPGLGRLADVAGEKEDPDRGTTSFSNGGAEDVVGVGTGVG